MPEPGLYLVNSTGETVPLATESGNGDRELLHEALDELGVEHPRSGFLCDVCSHTTEERKQTCPQCGVGKMEPFGDHDGD